MLHVYLRTQTLKSRLHRFPVPLFDAHLGTPGGSPRAQEAGPAVVDLWPFSG
jgi:hypothetical protein